MTQLVIGRGVQELILYKNYLVTVGKVGFEPQQKGIPDVTAHELGIGVRNETRGQMPWLYRDR